MKITAIQQQKKHSDRYSIFIDGTYKFSLSELDLVSSRLKVDQELTPLEIQEYSRASLFGKALDASYNYLSYRPRSIAETAEYLSRKYDDIELIEAVINKLQQLEYLDDYKFTSSWVADCQSLRPSSVQKLRAELVQKGIDKDIINSVLIKIGSDDQAESIKRLIRQKKLASRYDDKQKLIQYLTGQGFRYTEIKQALEELADENSP